MSLSQRRALVDPAAPGSLRDQCQWVGLHRSAYYYQPVVADPEDLLLMRLLDEQYLLTPFYGYRKMQLVLTQAGYLVNHKRVRRLMQLVGIEAIYARINTSKPALGHRIYPYLLRGLHIDRVHQVWATDITYVPMQTGYMYLMAIIDLHSRYVLKWSVSNTMAAEWCSRVLDERLANYPAPTIFNTDQGSQFTADVFTALLLKANVQISMDGKGRALDNIFRGRPCGRILQTYPNGTFATFQPLIPIVYRRVVKRSVLVHRAFLWPGNVANQWTKKAPEHLGVPGATVNGEQISVLAWLKLAAKPVPDTFGANVASIPPTQSMFDRPPVSSYSGLAATQPSERTGSCHFALSVCRL